MIPEKLPQKRILPAEEELAIREELLSIHAMNPYCPNDSSPRSIMFSSHIAQIITLMRGDQKITQTGIEKQFGENTFSKKIVNDVRIISIIKRYDGIDYNSVTKTTELFVVYEDLVTSEIDYMEVPYYFSLHQYFGFQYNWNEDVLTNIGPGDFVPGGTILADSPSVGKNSSYDYGLNANTALLDIAEVAEDGMVISESMRKRLGYKIYERRVVSYGTNSFPLNIYGDEKNYVPFPDIGEYINDDSVLMALRKYDTELSPALVSVKDTMDFDPQFDETIYVKSPGSKIVDIKAYKNPKFKKSVYHGTSGKTEKYVEGFTKFSRDVIEIYDKLNKDHYKKYKNNDLKVSEKFNKLVLDSYAVANPFNKKIRKTYKSEEMDLYRIEFVIESIVYPNIGGKLTDSHGGKGVIVEIRPDHLMPIDKNGNRADLISDSKSISSRMNVGKPYEMYNNSMSRHTKKMILDKISLDFEGMSVEEAIEVMSPEESIGYFNIALGLLEIFNTEQYYGYKQLVETNNIYAIKEILLEIVTVELILYYKVSSDKKPYQIVCDAAGTIYETPIGKAWFNKDGSVIEGKLDLLIAPLYIILLFKTGDEYLSVASAKTNHYKFPIGSGKAGVNSVGYRANPTKFLSETETRLFASYTTRKVLAELKDRANSCETHEIVYKNILDADIPTNVDCLVDREVHPFGTDSSLELISSVINSGGVKLTYVPDPTRFHL